MKSSKLALMLLALPFQTMSIDLSEIASQTAGNIQSLFKKEEKEDECQQLKNDLLNAIYKTKDARIKNIESYNIWKKNMSYEKNNPEYKAWQESKEEVTHSQNILDILNESLEICKKLQKKA